MNKSSVDNTKFCSECGLDTELALKATFENKSLNSHIGFLKADYSWLESNNADLLVALKRMLETYGGLHALYDIGDCQSSVEARELIAKLEKIK